VAAKRTNSIVKVDWLTPPSEMATITNLRLVTFSSDARKQIAAHVEGRNMVKRLAKPARRAERRVTRATMVPRVAQSRREEGKDGKVP
jgi:hypothetical protein